MILTLMDYNNEKTTFDIGDLETVSHIDINIISGDEVANVIYRDGHKKVFDSSTSRIIHTFDGLYCLYDTENEINDFDKFNNRSDVMNMVEEFMYEE